MPHSLFCYFCYIHECNYVIAIIAYIHPVYSGIQTHALKLCQDVKLCQVMSSFVTLCCIKSSYVKFCQVMSSNVKLCQVMSSLVKLCQVTSSLVKVCHVMSSYVMLCQVRGHSNNMWNFRDEGVGLVKMSRENFYW